MSPEAYYALLLLFIAHIGAFAPMVGTLQGALPTYSSLPATSKPFAVVGGSGSDYPIAAGITNSDVQLNAGMSALDTAGGGVLFLKGGPATTWFTSATFSLLDDVDVYSDGVVIEPAAGSAFTPVIGNGPAELLTNLTYFGMGINANSANTSFATQAFTPVTATPFIVGTGTPTSGLTGVTTGSGLITASAAVTSITISGRTWDTTGPWYVTPTDTVNLTFSAGQTFTYTQNCDGAWWYNMSGCRWIACGPWNPGASALGQAGVMYSLEHGTHGSGQVSSGNIFDIFQAQGGNWQAGCRFNGDSTYGATDTLIQFFEGSYLFRGIDIGNNADTQVFLWARTAGNRDYYAGFWAGSPGTSAAPCTSMRLIFRFLNFDNNGGSHQNAVVIGYYQKTAGGASTVFPGIQIDSLTLGGTLSNWNPVIQDLRATAVADYDINDVNNAVKYQTGGVTFVVNGQSNSLGVAPSASFSCGNPAGVALAATFKMMGLAASGATQPILFTPRRTGIVKVTLVCQANTSVAADGLRLKLMQGAGANGPNNAAAVSGTDIQNADVQWTQPAANSAWQVTTLVGYVAGLAVGTQIWIDVAVAWVTTGGTGSLASVFAIVEELAA